MLALAFAAAVMLAPATEQRRITAPEANQGVAVDDRSIYAITNNEIARYDKRTGLKVTQWRGDPQLFRHINSCAVVSSNLICASSNYPDVPMASSIEIFDKRTLRHVRTRSLPMQPGSLTVLDWHNGSWWAIYANYDGRGGEPGRGHEATILVRMDKNFVSQESWLFPRSVLDRFSPKSCSGASWGNDKTLYVSGHDLPEIYAVRLPSAGSTLIHVATIPISTNGQAIDWDDFAKRTLWSINRPTKSVVASAMPDLPK